MKNAILFSRGRKVTKKTLGLFLFLFTLLFSAGVVSAQTCSLVAEDQISAAVDENCEATITVGAVLDGMMTSCPGGDLVVYIYDALGQEVASGAPAIVPEGYVGQSLTAIVLDNISGNMSNDCILDIYDNLVPTVEC